MVTAGGVRYPVRFIAITSQFNSALNAVRARTQAFDRQISRIRGRATAYARATPGAVGRGASALGGAIGKGLLAGAGIGAGIAVIEKIGEFVTELLEGAPQAEAIGAAFRAIATALAPLVLSLLPSFTNILLAVEPILRALVIPLEYVAQGLEFLTGILSGAIQYAVPGAARALGVLFSGINRGFINVRTFVLQIITGLLEQLKAILDPLPQFIDQGLDVSVGKAIDRLREMTTAVEIADPAWVTTLRNIESIEALEAAFASTAGKANRALIARNRELTNETQAINARVAAERSRVTLSASGGAVGSALAAAGIQINVSPQGSILTDQELQRVVRRAVTRGQHLLGQDPTA